MGTNNIVLNRVQINIVDAATKSKLLVDAFVCIIPLHVYIYALERQSEAQVRPLVYKISRESFGEDHIATKLAEMGPWFILKDIPLDVIDLPKCVMETTRAQIVKDWREQLIYMLSDQRGIEKPILTNPF